MMDALIVSNLALWAIVIVLAVVVLALMRQVGALHERIAPAGALMGSEAPKVGEVAPELELLDWNERPFHVGGADPEGRSTLVFFVSPTCPVCKGLIPVVRSLRRAERGSLRVVLASDGPRAEHEVFVRRERLERESYVLSPELGLRYQVAKLPYGVLIGPDGVIRARGLVNSREHLESLLEASERGTASIQEFLHTATASTA